MFLKEVE